MAVDERAVDLDLDPGFIATSPSPHGMVGAAPAPATPAHTVSVRGP